MWGEKPLLLIIILIFLIPAPVYADWVFDDIRSAIKRRVPYDEVRALENKYRRRVISGEGYVLKILRSQTINGYEIHLVEDYDPEKPVLLGDVSVEIPEGSPYSKVVDKLEVGQRVSFGGKISSLFGKTIYIKGSAKISPK